MSKRQAALIKQNLDNQHKRLMRQRDQILQKEYQKLQLYEKIDLVQFFNYKPQQRSAKNMQKNTNRSPQKNNAQNPKTIYQQNNNQQQMYHLTQKFREYMKRFTENNVYKRMNHLINNQQQIKFLSKLKSNKKSNVQKNSDLGRRFQMENLKNGLNGKQKPYQANCDRANIGHYNNSQFIQKIKTQPYYAERGNKSFKHQAQSYANIHELQNFPKRRQFDYQQNSKIDHKLNHRNDYNQNQKINSISKVNQRPKVDSTSKYYSASKTPNSKKNQNTLNDNYNQTFDNLIVCGEISDNQLLNKMTCFQNTLIQQQKILVLSQLNHYIKLYKQAQLKQKFMQEHLENLYQFILQIKNKDNANKIYKNQTNYEQNYFITENLLKSETSLKLQNKMLRKQLQIYRQEIKALNKFDSQQFLTHNNNSILTPSKSTKSPPQIKKIDRFKQFSQNIQTMNLQLNKIKNQFQSKSININLKQQVKHEKIFQEEINTLRTYSMNLQQQLKELKRYYDNQEEKKQQFFVQVKNFKQMMNKKDEENVKLKRELEYYKDRCRRMASSSKQVSSSRSKSRRSARKGLNQSNVSKQQFHTQRFIPYTFSNIKTVSSQFQSNNNISSKFSNTFHDPSNKDGKYYQNNFQIQPLYDINKNNIKNYHYSRITTKQPSQVSLNGSMISRQKDNSSKYYQSRSSSKNKQINSEKCQQVYPSRFKQPKEPYQFEKKIFNDYSMYQQNLQNKKKLKNIEKDLYENKLYQRISQKS